MKTRGKVVDKQKLQIMWALYAGVLASILWIIGDILIVGFAPIPEEYPLFLETYASRVDVELATLMLTGSTQRLMWGALLAVFSIPFYLYSLLAIFKLIKGRLAKLSVILLFMGFSYWPLAHSGFFYVAEIYKAILNTDTSAHEVLLNTADGFVEILKIVWITGIGLAALGWLLFAIAVLMGKTYLRKSMFWVNPIVFTFLVILIAQLLPIPYENYIGCAAFNEAHFLFFVLLLFIVIKTFKVGDKV